jgi:hypothetical protein
VTMPPTSIPAPRGTGDIRHVAQHESGHAAAFWALGVPFERLAMNGSHGPAVYPLRGTSIPRAHNWVIQACGVIADQQARGLSMRGSQIVRLVLGGRGDSDHHPVGPVQPGLWALAPQHRDLFAQDQQLGVLRGRGAC